MEKRKKIATVAAVVIIIITAIAAACIGGYLAGRPGQQVSGKDIPSNTESSGKTEQDKPGKAENPPDSTPSQPSAPSQTPSQPVGEEPVVVYVPDEQSESLTPVGAAAVDHSDQALVDALIQAGSLPEGVEVLSANERDGVLTLDMNAAYGEAVRSSGTAGETMLIYSLVNTFIQARGVDKVLVTVEGATLESGHEVYDYPMEMKEFQ